MPGETRPNILVVEDDESITLGLQMNLEAEGYAVTVANDGEDGLGRARSEAFDLIVLDVMLPKLNGFELIRAKDPFTAVIFGASGDLARRKLVPALYHLQDTGYLPPKYAVVGFARTELTDDAYRYAITMNTCEKSCATPIPIR